MYCLVLFMEISEQQCVSLGLCTHNKTAKLSFLRNGKDCTL